MKSLKSEVVSYTVAFEEEVNISLFEEASLQIEKLDRNSYRISSKSDARKVIMKIVGDQELPLINITKEEQSLEGVFQELTQGK